MLAPFFNLDNPPSLITFRITFRYNKIVHGTYSHHLYSGFSRFQPVIISIIDESVTFRMFARRCFSGQRDAGKALTARIHVKWQQRDDRDLHHAQQQYSRWLRRFALVYITGLASVTTAAAISEVLSGVTATYWTRSVRLQHRIHRIAKKITRLKYIKE